MLVVTVEFDLRPGAGEMFLPRILENAHRSLAAESGCRRFDVCVDPQRRDCVFLYELYDDQDAFEAHLASDHYLAFDASTRDLVAEKRVRRLGLAASRRNPS